MELHGAFRQRQVVQRLEWSKVDKERLEKEKMIRWVQVLCRPRSLDFMNRQWRFEFSKVTPKSIEEG